MNSRMSPTFALRSFDRHTKIAGVATGCVLALGSVVAVLAQQQELIQVRYRQTTLAKTEAAAPALAEEGTYWIDPRGRYRIDRIRNGTHSIEIVNCKDDLRVMLDVGRKRAVVTSLSTVITPPGFAGASRSQPAAGQGGPLTRVSDHRVDLGARTIGGRLTVTGTRDEIVFLNQGRRVSHTFERWIFQFPEATMMPVALEERFEGESGVSERKIADVSVVPIAEDLFAIPSGFEISDLRHQGGKK